MSLRKICLVGAVLGTTAVGVANADTTRLRRKIKLDTKGNFRIHLNGNGNMVNLQDMVKSIMKSEEPSDVIGMLDGLVSSIVGDAIGSVGLPIVGGRRLSIEGNFLANGAQDRSFKPDQELSEGEQDRKIKPDLFDGHRLEVDGTVLEGDLIDLLDKSEETDHDETDKSPKKDRSAKREEKRATKEEKRATKEEKRATKEEKRATKEEKRATKEEKRATKEEKRATKEEKRATKEEERANKEEKHAEREKRTKHLDRQERKEEKQLEKELESELESKDRGFSIAEFEREKDGLLHRSDRRLRGLKGSEEVKVSQQVLVSLETLQIVLQEFDTLNVFDEKNTTEGRVAKLLTRIKTLLREKLDALAERRAERQAARDERVAVRRDERAVRKEAREDLDFELEIIQKIRAFLEDFSIRDHDLLQFADREPTKVVPSFDRVTKCVLDFNDGARRGFIYEKSRTLDKSLGRLNMQYEKHLRLERAPKIKGGRFGHHAQEETEEPIEETEVPEVTEEVEEKLAKEKFHSVVISLANLKQSLLQKEKEWGLLREEFDAVEAEVEEVERKHNLRSRRTSA